MPKERAMILYAGALIMSLLAGGCLWQATEDAMYGAALMFALQSLILARRES